MRLLILSAALLGAMPFGTASAARCTADTVSLASLEVVSAARIAGVIGGIDAATVDVLHRGETIASGAASDGQFTIDLPPLAPESMLALRVRGLESNDQAFIELGSHVGTVQQLIDEADVAGIARVGAVPGLAVSAESTARYVLAQRALPEGAADVGHECQLARLHAAIDADEQRRIAAVIKILIADGLPAAFAQAAKGSSATTTFELVQDELQLEAAVDRIETESPGRIAEVQALLAESFCDYFNPEAILLFQPRALGQVMNSFGGGIYQTINAQGGRHIDGFGPDAYTFACSGDALDAQFSGSRVSVSFPVREVNGTSMQVRQEFRVRDSRITRVDSNANFITVAERQTTANTYPFNPTLADEIVTAESRLVLIRQAPGTPFDAATVPGEYLAPTSGQVGDQTANRILLQEGGTGSDLDANASLSWEVTAAGDLVVQFDDRTARLIPLRDEASNVGDVISIVELATGERRINAALLLRRTDVAFWNDINAVPGRYTQHSGRASGAPFRIDFAADRSAPAFSGEQLNFTFHWSRPSASQVVLRICESFDGANRILTPIVDREPAAGECLSWYRRRTWTAYTADGDRYYIHEHNEDWYSDPSAGQPAAFVFSRGIHYQYAPPLSPQKRAAASADTPSGAAARQH